MRARDRGNRGAEEAEIPRGETTETPAYRAGGQNRPNRALAKICASVAWRSSGNRRSRRPRSRPAEAIDAARIAREKGVAAERIEAELATRSEEIARDKAIEAADIARRESVERARIVAELKLEEERIASQQSREVIDIQRKREVEAAEETRVVELAPKKAARAAAEAEVRRAQLTAQASDRELPKSVARRPSRRPRSNAAGRSSSSRSRRVQALREAEIESREDIERARVASERGLDEVRISHEAERRRLEVEREKLVETAQMDKAIALYRKSLEESAARLEADRREPMRPPPRSGSRPRAKPKSPTGARPIDVLLAEKAAAESTIAAGAEQGAAHGRGRGPAPHQRGRERPDGPGARLAVPPQAAGACRRHRRCIREAAGKDPGHPHRAARRHGRPGGEGRSGSPTDEVINSALRYRVQAPLIDSLLADIGIDGANLAKQGA